MFSFEKSGSRNLKLISSNSKSQLQLELFPILIQKLCSEKGIFPNNSASSEGSEATSDFIAFPSTL